MRRICFMNTTRFWGGGEKLHLEYAIKFRDMGYVVWVCCSRSSPLDTKARSFGLKVFNIDIRSLSFLNPRKTGRLSTFFTKQEIDTLIFSGSTDFKAGSVAAQKAAISRIVYLRGLAVQIKGSIINRYLLKRVVTHIIANSEETKRTILKNQGRNFNKDKVKVIYHGIDLSEYPNSETGQTGSSASEEAEIIIGSAGRLTRQKAQHLLIDTARLLKKRGLRFRMLIAGTGELEEELQHQIIDKGLQHEVLLQGFIYDIPHFMSSIDIFVLSSKWEGFGYVLVEAMAAGKPVVAFNITSNPEIIVHEQTGFLVTFPDVVTMADRIEQLIKDRDMARAMGAAGRRRVEEMFVLDDRIRELERVLLEKEGK